MSLGQPGMRSKAITPCFVDGYVVIHDWDRYVGLFLAALLGKLSVLPGAIVGVLTSLRSIGGSA